MNKTHNGKYESYRFKHDNKFWKIEIITVFFMETAMVKSSMWLCTDNLDYAWALSADYRPYEDLVTKYMNDGYADLSFNQYMASILGNEI